MDEHGGKPSSVVGGGEPSNVEDDGEPPIDEREAVDALEHLGLSRYEAKVFIALQALGVGTARDVARVTDVPRSQVYSTAEALEERGLIDVQRSNPIQYRPIGVEAARERLRDRFECQQERAFDYIETVRSERHHESAPENVWTITGRETIDARIASLLEEAERTALLGVRSTSLLTAAVERAVSEAIDRGVDVTVISQSDAVRARFADVDGVRVVEPRITEHPRGRSGRVLVVDGEAILLSVLADEQRSGTPHETAIWSARTGFARVFVELLRGFLRPT